MFRLDRFAVFYPLVVTFGLAGLVLPAPAAVAGPASAASASGAGLV